MIPAVFQHVKDTLNTLQIPWALIGGLAVSVQTDPRFTEDIDISVSLTSDKETEQLIFALQKQGWSARMILEQTYFDEDIIATVRFLTPISDHVYVDLLFASSGIEKEIIEQAETIEIFENIEIPTAQIGHLIALKLLSEDSDRPKDTQDIKNLIKVASEKDINLAHKACHLISKRGFHRQKNLLEQLEQHLDKK